MSDPNQPSVPPGWYPDGQGGQRWWDGKQWTEHTQPSTGGAPAAPAAPAAPSGPPPGAPPGDMPTMVAPNRAAGYPQQPAAPQQPTGQQPAAAQQGVYGAPAGQPAGQYGQQPFGGYPSSSGSSGGKGKLIAIIGGGLGALLLLVILVVVLLKVLGGGSPEDVAKDYLDAGAEGDFEKACELSTKDHQQDLFEDSTAKECGDLEDAFAKSFEEQGIPGYDSYQDFFDDIDYKYEIGDVKEKEKTATVEYTYSVEYTGDNDDFGEFFNEDETDAELKLVKEDGEWLVDSDSGDDL